MAGIDPLDDAYEVASVGQLTCSVRAREMASSGSSPLPRANPVNWLGSVYGAACAGPAAIISALAGHPEGQAALADRAGAQEPTFNDLSDLLGIHLFPAMIWSCAGLVATIGDTNIAWLRQFRLAG